MFLSSISNEWKYFKKINNRYIFFGGFESQKGICLIKLYKIEYLNVNKNIELMYIQGIIINNSVCERTINWIFQTKEKRSIIFTYTHEDIIFILILEKFVM